jgi:hypothetical protein
LGLTPALRVLPAASLLFIQLILCGWAESKRWLDFKSPGSQGDGSFFGITDDFKGVANGYPGGKLFDPFGLSRGSEAQFKKYQVRCPCQPLTLHAFLSCTRSSGKVQHIIFADP